MSDFPLNLRVKSQLRLHIDFYMIAVVLNFVIWATISFSDYINWPLNFIVRFLLAEVFQTFVETGVMFCLSILVSRFCLFIFKKAGSFRTEAVAFELALLFILNFMVLYLIAIVYVRMSGHIDTLYRIRIIAIDGTVMSFISTGILISYLYTIWEERKEYARQIELQAIEQKNTAVKARLDKLTLELDPHYIFNGLSTLSGLITTDPEAADEFLAKFSSTFRYLLDNRESHLMSVRDEYRFMKKYTDLLCYRYGNIDLDISEDIAEVSGYIPTASLQVLVENAIKHNAHTSDHHLKIDVYFNNGYIAVKNDIIPLEYAIDSTKIGLNNLSERYSYMTERTVKVSNDGQTFCVELPVLHEEDLLDE